MAVLNARMAAIDREYSAQRATVDRAAKAAEAQIPLWYGCLRERAAEIARRSRESAGDIASATMLLCRDVEAPIRSAMQLLSSDGQRVDDYRKDAHAAIVSFVINLRAPTPKRPATIRG